MEFWKRKIN